MLSSLWYVLFGSEVVVGRKRADIRRLDWFLSFMLLLDLCLILSFLIMVSGLVSPFWLPPLILFSFPPQTACWPIPDNDDQCWGYESKIISSLNANHPLRAWPESTFFYSTISHHYVANKVGFHATDAASFAEAVHSALTLSNNQATKTRQAARALAKEKFSLRAFEKSWEKSWGLLKKRSRVRRAEADGAEYDRVNRV